MTNQRATAIMWFELLPYEAKDIIKKLMYNNKFTLEGREIEKAWIRIVANYNKPKTKKDV